MVDLLTFTLLRRLLSLLRLWLVMRRQELNIILKALEAPLFHISANAGLEGAVIINKVREQEPGIGFDAYKEEYVDMVKEGIL